MFVHSVKRWSNFNVGQRFCLPIKKIVPTLGLFFELSPGFDALLHKSMVPNGDLAAYAVGQFCQVCICALDAAGRVQLTFVDAPNLPPDSSAAAMPRTSAAAWRQTHPVEDSKAHAWLLDVTRNAALHATLLAELKKFGVPVPISSWLALHSEFVSFGPKNPVSAHPCVGLASRLQDVAYWRNPTRVLQSAVIQPAMTAPIGGMDGRSLGSVARTIAERFPTQPRNDSVPNSAHLLIDGSNLIRTFPSGGKALAALLLAFDHAGRDYNVLFDATIRHVLEETKDIVGEQLLSTCPSATIVPAGTPADDYLLLLADRKGCSVVSNDRFEQYRDRYQWLGARVESAERRLHAVAEIGGELVAPTLGLVAHI